MADGILGLGSSGSSGLNQELIDKLKSAEAKGKVDIYDTKLATWDKELETITTIETKVQELLSSVSNFDLYKSGTNAFEQVTANTTGTAAIFDAVDVSGLQEGSTTVIVTQLAQKDVYQTNSFTDPNVQVLNGNDVGDKISIAVEGTTYDFSTEGKTYTQLADDINLNSKLNASVEQVGDNSYRLVIKSQDSGLANSLSITETGVSLGFTNTLSAQNMNASVDGIAYDISSNTITIQGNLTMTAVELGTSTISIQKDNSAILPGITDFVTKYNELVDLVDAELYSSDTSISDLSSLRSMMDNIKGKFFGSYGANNDLNVFNFGFGLDATGHINIDEAALGTALTDDLASVKDLFIGSAENPGLGTQMKEYVDGLDGSNGLLTAYGENMATRKTTYEEDKAKAQEALDSKYSLMSLEFASYTAIITQMENSFGGMKMMMDQSTASNN